MKFKTVTSPHNPAVREALRIKSKGPKGAKSAKTGGGGEFIIEGPHLIEMAASSGAPILKVFFTEGFSGSKEGGALIRKLARTEAELFEVTEAILKKLSDTEAPQGITAVSASVQAGLDVVSFKGVPLIAVSDGVSDPGNLGSIIRTADGAGADGVVVLPGSADPFSQKALRASHGSVFNLPVVLSERGAFIGWAEKKGIALAVAHQKAEGTIYEADLRAPLAFIFGNEAHGASKEARAAAGMELRVPIYGKAESLNVGHSAAICLYEAMRQRESKSYSVRGLADK